MSESTAKQTRAEHVHCAHCGKSVPLSEAVPMPPFAPVGMQISMQSDGATGSQFVPCGLAAFIGDAYLCALHGAEVKAAQSAARIGLQIARGPVKSC